MAYRLSTNSRNKGVAAVVAEIDLNSPPGKLFVRTSAQPATVNSADVGTLLGTLTFSNPAFGTPSSGVATANAITSETNAPNSGTAGHFRMKDGSGNIHSDGTCGQGTGDLSFDNNVIVAGGTIAISSLTVTQPT